MQLKNISLLGLVALVLMTALPQTAGAYYTTNQHADRVTNNTALYAVTYTFGLREHDIYLPIGTARNIENDLNTPMVGYSFTTSDEGNPNAGTATGLVVSNATVVDNMYMVPAGERTFFTLFVTLTLDEADAKAKYALQVDNLPYLKVDADGNKTQLGLNIHELGSYTTKKVGLNR